MVVRLAVAVGVAVRVLGTSAQGSTCASCQGCVQSQDAVPWCTVGFDSWECAPAGVTADAATCWCVDEEGTEISGSRRPGVGDLSCVATQTMGPATEQLIRAGHICPAFNSAYYNASLGGVHVESVVLVGAGASHVTFRNNTAVLRSIAEECHGHEACTWIPSYPDGTPRPGASNVCIACVPGAYYRGCFFFGTADAIFLIPITMILSFLTCACLCTGTPPNAPGRESIILADVFCECCSPEADSSDSTMMCAFAFLPCCYVRFLRDAGRGSVRTVSGMPLLDRCSSGTRLDTQMDVLADRVHGPARGVAHGVGLRLSVR